MAHSGMTDCRDAIMAGNFRKGVFDGSEFKDDYVFMRGSKSHAPIVSKRMKAGKNTYKLTRWVDVEDRLNIVNSTRGCTTEGEYQHFILAPREKSVGKRIMGGKGDMQQRLFETYRRLEATTPSDTCRATNVKRVRMTDGYDSKYIIIGTSPKRSGKGSQECMKGFERAECELQRKLFGIWFKRVEHCIRGYLPWYLKELLKAVGNMCRHGMMPVGHDESSDIWPALAVGRNVYLNVHTDEDYCWTLTTVVTNETPSMDSPVVSYMCFPTLGTAVALRNGDLLMFNPLIPHCLSTRCSSNRDVYCVSMYMKSLLVGGSDNDQILSRNDKEMAQFVLDNCTKKRGTDKVKIQKL